MSITLRTCHSFSCASVQMELCCLVPPASVVGVGRDLSGSTATLPKPPTRNSAKLVCRLRQELWMPNGYRTKVLLWHQTRVNSRYQTINQHITSPDILVLSWTLFERYPAGALELWELAENEHLLVNRFTKHDHDNIVTTVSPVIGSSGAVTGSMDCRWGFVILMFISNHGSCDHGRTVFPVLSFFDVWLHLSLVSFFLLELKCGISVRRCLSLRTMVRGGLTTDSIIKLEVIFKVQACSAWLSLWTCFPSAHTQPVNCVACSPTEESLFISCGQVRYVTKMQTDAVSV